MRVLVLSPGTAQQQLERMPAIAACANELGASIQVACSPGYRSLWTLLPSVEKIIPFDFSANLTMADWANLLGCVREPDFQVCLNFAEGRQVNLMLSMSHIPTRVAEAGFAATAEVRQVEGWSAQRCAGFLAPLGLSLDAAAFRISLPAALIQACDHSSHSFFHPPAQFDWASTSGRIAKPLLDHCLGEHGGRCGAIASFVLGLSRHLLDQLGSNVFERICKFDLFSDRVTVVDDVGRAIGLLEHHIAAFRSDRDPNGISKGIHAALKGLT